MTSEDYRSKCLNNKQSACFVCGDEEQLVVHHKDNDQDNNDLENLIPLCYSCHAKVHTSKDPSGTISELQEELGERKGATSIWVTEEVKQEVWETKLELELLVGEDLSYTQSIAMTAEIAMDFLERDATELPETWVNPDE